MKCNEHLDLEQPPTLFILFQTQIPHTKKCLRGLSGLSFSLQLS